MRKFEIIFVLSFVLFILVLAITPVGGWCESNPHHEDYKFMFGASGLFLLASTLLLIIDNRKKLF